MAVDTTVSPSILQSTKKALGLDPDYDAFDPEIIMFINSELSRLRQVGFGPKNGYIIDGPDQTWEDYFGDTGDYQFVKDYIYCRVRLMFDPPGNSFGIDALEKHSQELLWRINVEYEVQNHPLDEIQKEREYDPFY